LDVRRQVQEVHDLRGPGPGHVPQPGDVGHSLRTSGTTPNLTRRAPPITCGQIRKSYSP
jgi:hypothetical protein